MKLHPDAGELRLYAEGNRTGIDAHVAVCGDCRATVDWIDAVRRTLREAAGPMAPASTWGSIKARLEAGDSVVLPGTVDRPAHNRVRIAAALVLLSVAGIAAALPGSPLRGWFAGVLDPGARTTPAPTGAPAPEPEALERTRLIVEPDDDVATIALQHPGADVRLRVRWAEGREIEVDATGVASRAHFRSGPGRLTIADAAGGEIVLTLPRSGSTVAITVDGESYLVQRDEAVTVMAPGADTIGGEIVLRLRPSDRPREQ